MNLRNRLNPGTFIVPIPIGAMITLTYNEDGNLSRCMLGCVGEDVDKQIEISNNLGNDFCLSLINNGTVPATVPLKDEIVNVTGVLSFKLESFENLLGSFLDNQKLITKKYNDTPYKFTFYATSMRSTSTFLRGGYNIQNWLKLSKFNTLPNGLCPVNSEQFGLDEFLHHIKYPFGKDNMMAVAVFDGVDSIKYYCENIHQYRVEDLKDTYDDMGYLYCNVCMKDDNSKIVKRLPYDYYISSNIKLKSNVCIRDDDTFFAYSTSKCKDKNIQNEEIVRCKYCGNLFNVVTEGYRCTNEDCPSRLPQRIKQFINVMHLPEVSKYDIRDLVNQGSLLSLPDIFTLDEYKYVEVNTSLKRLIRAIVPIDYIRSNKEIDQLVDCCQNNSVTFLHYLKHTDRIVIDLNAVMTEEMDKLISWLDSDCNFSDINTLLSIPNIVVENCCRRFDGAPIFRGQTVVITGTFIHGSHSDINAVISSYDANVSDKFDDSDVENINCVVVGSLNKNTDSTVVSNASLAGIPIYTERDFFLKYGIDEDLKNLK